MHCFRLEDKIKRIWNIASTQESSLGVPSRWLYSGGNWLVWRIYNTWSPSLRPMTVFTLERIIRLRQVIRYRYFKRIIADSICLFVRQFWRVFNGKFVSCVKTANVVIEVATYVMLMYISKIHFGYNGILLIPLANPDYIFNNYSTSARWIWDGRWPTRIKRRVGYNHLISNESEWNNCFIKNVNKISRNLPDFICKSNRLLARF